MDNYISCLHNYFNYKCNYICFAHLIEKTSGISILEDLREWSFQNFVRFAPNSGGCLPELSCQKHSK